MKRTILILGASSSIARATALQFAKQGYPIYLAGRDDEDIARIAKDVRVCCETKVYEGHFDAFDTDSHGDFFKNVVHETDGLGGVLVGFGIRGDVEKSQHDFSEVKKVFDCNLLGACSILTYCAEYFEQQGCGFIAAITSIAGDYGRQDNYVYATAKGALEIFMEGLRTRLERVEVQVTTIKPGLVDTAMTFSRYNPFPKATPEAIGIKIVRAIEQKKKVVYVPGYWRIVMMIAKVLPNTVINKIKDLFVK
jgi:short-subunit dehydrogenase